MDLDSERSPRPALRVPRKNTVFWRVAGILVGVQVLIAAVAVLLTFQLSYDHFLRLAANSVRLRLDAAALEMEERVDLRGHLDGLPASVLIDIQSRFEDPVFLLQEDGRDFAILSDGRVADLGENESPKVPSTILIDAREAFVADSLALSLARPLQSGSWAAAPLYDADGFRAGGLLVFPLSQTLDAELAATRSAYLRSAILVSALAVFMAVVLGVFFTLQIVRPLQQISLRVEEIGAGDFDRALPEGGGDEFGRLATSINAMADRIRSSITALKSADETRRRMVANMGHDLRTPLAGLLGYTEQALHVLEKGRIQEAKEALATASRQGQYLGSLVDDLFELSLLDSVPAPIRTDPVPLGELLSEVASAHRVRFGSSGILFRTDLASGLPVIVGDGVRLLRLLDNLLSNALRHTPPGGTVVLSARSTEAGVNISVEDSGEGIGVGEEDVIFERHVRGRDARTRRSQGSGLGLAISRSIARAHGGELSAHRGERGGACFVLLLPISNEEAPAA